MRSIKTPERMTPQERLDEVTAILAAGFLRLRSRRGYVPQAESDAAAAPEGREKSFQN